MAVEEMYEVVEALEQWLMESETRFNGIDNPAQSRRMPAKIVNRYQTVKRVVQQMREELLYAQMGR